MRRKGGLAPGLADMRRKTGLALDLQAREEGWVNSGLADTRRKAGLAPGL